MTAHATINTALAFRGLLPMDGYCVCDRCKVDTFDRKDMHTVEPHEQIARRAAKHGKHFCQQCIDLMYYAADDAANPHMRKEAPAPICHHHVESKRMYHATRGVFYNDHCPHCNGYGQAAQEQSA